MNIGSVSRYVFWMALSSVAAVMLSGKQMPTEDDATFVYAIFGAFCGWLMALALVRRPPRR